VDAAIAIGRRIGSRHIAVLTGADPAREKSEQRAAMAANLRRLAGRAADDGMVLCVEAVDAGRLPRMLLHHLSDAIEVVRGADHPAVRLVFDFAHVQAMDGNVLNNMDAAWDMIELIQLAPCPEIQTAYLEWLGRWSSTGFTRGTALKVRTSGKTFLPKSCREMPYPVLSASERSVMTSTRGYGAHTA
jgi:hypothetical protein